MTSAPYLFLDIDGVLHGTYMKVGFEQTRIIEERIPTELVHPALRPKKLSSGFGGEIPEWVARRRPDAPNVVFRTPVRVSKRLLEELDGFNLDVRMLTTWLEHDSVDAFFAQGPVPAFRYSKLRFPGRDHTDPVAAIPERWKVDQLHLQMEKDPKPFIWADDDEVPKWRGEIADRYTNVPHLLLAPLDGVGLTRFHLDEVSEFLSSIE